MNRIEFIVNRAIQRNWEDKNLFKQRSMGYSEIAYKRAVHKFGIDKAVSNLLVETCDITKYWGGDDSN